jgi:hypothetical protein
VARRLLLVAAIAVFLGAGILAISLPPRLTCASLGYPEGTRCKEGRVDFEDHGPFVSVYVDRRSGPRLAILGSGTIVATLLLLLGDRQPPVSAPKERDSGLKK